MDIRKAGNRMATKGRPPVGASANKMAGDRPFGGGQDSHRRKGRRWQMGERVEGLHRALDPEPRVVGCALGAG